MNFRIFIVAVVALGLCLWGTASSQETARPPALDKVRLQLKWRHQFQFAGYYAAKAKGYYEEAGLDVELLVGNTAIHPAAEVGSGRADYGVGMPYLMVERAIEGQPVVILAPIFQHSPEVFLTLASSGIDSPEKLRGKRIAQAPFSTPACRALLEAKGIKEDHYIRVPLGFGVEQLLSGEADAITAYSTDEPFELEQRGIAYHIIQPKDGGIDFYGDCLFTSEAELSRNRDRAHRFRQASIRGWRYAMSHPEEIIDLIINEYHSPLSREHLQFEARAMQTLIDPNVIELGAMSEARWIRIRDTFAKLGIIRAEYDLSNLLYEPVRMVSREQFQRAVMAGTVSGIVLATLLLWVYILMRRRHHQAVEMRTILDTVVQGIITTNAQGVIYSANAGAERIFGFPAGELKGHQLRDLFTGDHDFLLGLDRRPEDIETQAVLGLDQDITALRMDGTSFPAHITLGHSFVNGEHIFVGVIDDLTERRRVERELAESELRLQTVIDNMHSVFFIKDRQSRHLLVNDYYEKATGFSREQVLGKTDAEFFPEEVGRSIIAMDEAVMTSGVQRRFEESVPNPDGTMHYYTTEKLPLRDAEGTVVGLVGIATDITERKVMETELRTQQERLSLTLRAANLGLWDWRPQEDELYTNNIWAEMLGYSTAELDAMYPRRRARWAGLMHPEDLQYAQDAIQNCIAGKTHIFRSEVRMLTKSGAWKWILSTGQIIERYPDGSVARFAGIHMDIEDFKRLQADLELAREAAEAADRAKSRFLANMSHEIRTPMNAVVNLAELLLETELDERQQQYLRVINSSARSLLKLINDVLDLSKIEAAKLELETIPFRPGELLEELSLTFGEQTARKEVALTITAAEDVPHTLAGDVYRLRQVLVNLISNAIKFTAQGEVSLTVEVASPPDETGNVQLRFTVRDTGIGIAEEDQARLFNAFSQADSSTTRKFGGTGLGLAISDRLVRLLGEDRIHLESEAGKGSTFRFQLPFQVVDVVETTKTTTLAGVRVLVVEDNPASRSAYVSMLQRFGADPVGVEGSREAQSAIESQARFDMALLSWHLPGGESPALLEKLRSANGHEAMPCAAIVGIASTAELDRLRELGVSSVLRKPLTGSQLLDAVMDTIGRCALPAPHQEPRKGNERFDGVRVLLVEDNRVNQMVTKEMLKRRGFQISVAENGRHALDQLENEAFDLILMDVQMPVMDGLEATRNIRLIEENARHEGANYKHIPIIAMTANAMQGDERTCLDAGMDAYVAKPLDINLLIERIKLFIRPVNPAEHA